MKSFEDWIMYVFGGFVMVGSVVAGRITKVQDEQQRRLNEHDKKLAVLEAIAVGSKESLERMESKLDRVIEREHGA